MTQTEAPTVVRQLNTPESTELANLASVFEDLQYVLKCCEELVSRLARPVPDDVVSHALWSAALIAYVRCFTVGGTTGALTEQDLTATGLRGDVLEWHTMLRQLREHLTSTTANPRERFVIGAAQGTDGRVNGVAIVSSPLPAVDELTVRQTGSLALALAQLVDERLGSQQHSVFDAASAMSPQLLNSLPEVHVSEQ